MSDVILKEEVEITDNNNVSQISIPKRWAEKLNLEPGQDAERALMEGKHGLFFAVWSKNQPKE